MKHRGVTIIEVLAVMSILAVVVAITAPVISNARENARQTTCMSNLRQIGLAITMYRSEYGGDSRYGDPNMMGLPITYSPEVRESLLPSKEVWQCQDEIRLRPKLSGMSYYIYYPLTSSPPHEWAKFKEISEQYQEMTLLLYDMYHSDVRGLNSPFVQHLGIGLLTSGSAIRRQRAGDWLDQRWWTD